MGRMVFAELAEVEKRFEALEIETCSQPHLQPRFTALMASSADILHQIKAHLRGSRPFNQADPRLLAHGPAIRPRAGSD